LGHLEPGRAAGAAAAVALILSAGAAVAAPTWEMTFTLGTSPSSQLGPGVRWTKRPNDSEIFALFPKEAFEQRLSGVTLLECVATAEGTFADCAVVEEKPEGKGFAQASIAVMALYRFGPAERLKGEVVGKKVRLPIVWTTRRNRDRIVRP